MNYRYRINGIEVFPVGEWAIEYQRNEGQIFFRRVFTGELNFKGDDYAVIQGLNCEVAEFKIYCKDAEYWEGQFKHPYDFTFDDDSCVAVGTPEVVDAYSCIMDKYDYVYYTRVYLPVGGALSPQIWDCLGAGLIATLPAGYNLFAHFGEAAPGSGMINDPLFFNCGGIGVKSSFLWRDNFANGDNYAAAYGINNYITGATNRLEYIYLFASYNVRAAVSWGGTPCDIGESGSWSWTFKDWEDFFRIAFNAYWFIDENGDFRIEHISYFDPDFANSDYTVGIDLETVMDRGGRSYAYRRNKYTYETGRLYDQERWEWLHYAGIEGTVTHGNDFEGVPLFYGAAVDQKSDFVPGDFKEKKNASNKFWADVPWAIGLIAVPSPDSIKCDGYLFADIDTATTRVRCEAGVISTVLVNNGHCCTANLQNYYQRHDRIFLQGDMNSGFVTIFDTAQKHKLQDAIEFAWCCDNDFDPLDRIRTGLGDGEVKAAVRKQNSLEVELWHEFDCDTLCIPSGCIMWDGVNDRVQLATPPLVQITGNRIITIKAYIYSTGTFEPLAQFASGGTNDFLLVQARQATNQIGTYVRSGGGAGTSRQWNILPSHYNRCIFIEIVKTGTVITSCSIDGVPLAHDGSNPASGAITTSNIGYQDSPIFAGDIAVWDVKIYDFTPVLLHWWKGYPAGNLNAAWVDQIGPNNGTVTGTPNIYP